MKFLILSLMGIISAICIFLFGNIDINLKYLISVVILDFFTGLGKAYIKKEINSSIGTEGVFKKFSYFVIAAISVILGNLLEVGDLLKNIVIYSLIFNEMISIIENCNQMGVKLPTILISSLETFNSSEENIDKNKKKTKD